MRCKSFCYLLCILSLTVVAMGGDDSVKTTGLKHLQSVARELNVSKPVKLREKPLLSWTNPTRRADTGATFVWMRDGRPEFIASIYDSVEDVSRSQHFEVQSLTNRKIVAEFPSWFHWAPTDVALKFERVPDAPDVADSDRLRRIQMRALARRFSGRSLKNAKESQSQLRLLPAPLCEYRGNDNGAAALFAMAQGTDPEVIILLEARQQKTGTKATLAWYYAVARMSSGELRVRYRDAVVWKVSEIPMDRHTNPTHSYSLNWRRKRSKVDPTHKGGARQNPCRLEEVRGKR